MLRHVLRVSVGAALVSGALAGCAREQAWYYERNDRSHHYAERILWEFDMLHLDIQNTIFGVEPLPGPPVWMTYSE